MDDIDKDIIYERNRRFNIDFWGMFVIRILEEEKKEEKMIGKRRN